MVFPENRMRRLRSSEAMRKMVRQTSLNVTDLIYPLFVKAGRAVKEEIASMKGCFHFSPDSIVDEAKEIQQLGIPAILLFGQAVQKDEQGSQAWAEDGAVQQAVRAIKMACPQLLVITDVCLCAYTSHGHCGVVNDAGKIDNDASCELLAKVALSHAQAGADVIAPSDMMDGRVAYIRQAFEENGFYDTAIMAYSAKYASAFYGPFRDVADSTPTSGDRKTYQMDPANIDEAMAEIALDIEEGADIVMVKPAICFLDVISRAKAEFDIPVAAYNVSGEYMMINAAADAGVLDREVAMMEMLVSIKRAGADIIITYFAKEVAKLIK
ncbi:MAG: porphobilinogen synthase [Planctomycetes bacterium]|nr:porphobilinogen synthase [Planctomycetota bacterium]